MRYDPFFIKAEDGKDLYIHYWKPKGGQCKAVIQISHGMAEHAGRYEEFAYYMVKEGYAVYGNDHRGHGKTAGSLEEIGFFTLHSGWDRVVSDMVLLKNHIKDQWGESPLFLFGHSMGSLLVRNFIMEHSNGIKGVILSGTSGNPGILADVGRILAKIESMVRGKRGKSAVLNRLTFEQYNRKFKPTVTDFDWLSRDQEEVKKYITDPFCGGIFSCGFFYDLLTGIKIIHRKENIERIPKHLPILLISGERDPVGHNGKGVLEVYREYKLAGIEGIECKLYPDARHELLKEFNRHQVMGDIKIWMNSNLHD